MAAWPQSPSHRRWCTEVRECAARGGRSTRRCRFSPAPISAACGVTVGSSSMEPVARGGLGMCASEGRPRWRCRFSPGRISSVRGVVVGSSGTSPAVRGRANVSSGRGDGSSPEWEGGGGGTPWWLPCERGSWSWERGAAVGFTNQERRCAMPYFPPLGFLCDFLLLLRFCSVRDGFKRRVSYDGTDVPTIPPPLAI